MGLFRFITENIAIHIDTNNILVVVNGEIKVDSLLIISKSYKTGHTIYGKESKKSRDYQIIYPLSYGKITDVKAMTELFNNIIKSILKYTDYNKFFRSNINAIICIPDAISSRDKNLYKQVFSNSKLNKFIMVSTLLSSAIGIGCDVNSSKSNVILHIGSGTASIGAICQSEVHQQKSILIGIDYVNGEIFKYIKKKYSLISNRRNIDNIRRTLGAVTTDLESPPESMLIQGKNIENGKPYQVQIDYTNISEALIDFYQKIEDLVTDFIKTLSHEYLADLYNTGMYLSGEGAMLRGLDKCLSRATDLPVYVAEDPLRSAVRGTGIIAKDSKKYFETAKF